MIFRLNCHHASCIQAKFVNVCTIKDQNSSSQDLDLGPWPIDAPSMLQISDKPSFMAAAAVVEIMWNESNEVIHSSFILLQGDG